MRTLVLTTLLATMAACGSGGSSSNIPADFELLAGGGTSVDSEIPPNCLNCSVISENSAIDGNPGTAASFFIPSTNASVVSIKAIAQQGVVFPAGSELGVLYGLPNGVTTGVFSLNAYLDGTLVNSFQIQEGTEDQTPRSPTFSTASSTTGPFNEVELSFNKQSSARDAALDVYSFAVR